MRRRIPSDRVTIAMVGKYVDLPDSYKSLNEALMHAGIHDRTKVKIHFVDSEEIETRRHADRLHGIDAILVPGGFGDRGIEGKIMAAQYAREQRRAVPRHLPRAADGGHRVRAQRRGLEGAHSTEFNPRHAASGDRADHRVDGPHRRAGERDAGSDLGGTMRLGGQECLLEAGTPRRRSTARTAIVERHRHRYEFNNNYSRAAGAGGAGDVGLVAGRARAR